MDLKCSQQVEGMDATVVHTDAQASPTKEEKRFVEKKKCLFIQQTVAEYGGSVGGRE